MLSACRSWTRPARRSISAEPSGAPVVDFVGGALGHRLRRGVGRTEPLARAVGLRPGRRPRVVDATAGLGRDAILLAALGLDVTLVERSPAIRAALADGIARALQAGGLSADAAGRMTLLAGDARDLLDELHPEVVLVDPMHPPRGNTALVKKAMRDVREAVGADLDAADLLACALRAARDRVVLKWPLRAPPPAGAPRASHSYTGRTVRLDIFLTPRQGP